MHQDIAGLLTKYRTLAGLSMSELARRSGVSLSTISLIESGKRNPKYQVLHDISKGLEDRSFIDSVMNGEPEPQKTIIEVLKGEGLSDTDIEDCLGFINFELEKAGKPLLP